MTAPILLTGGTGTLGRRVLPCLRAAGATVRVLSRHEHEPTDGVEYVLGDLATGRGVAAAAAGVRTILHCAGTAKGDDHKARALVEAATDAEHVVFISVVGADQDSFGYFAAKSAAERIIAESGTPWSTLRATQFYDSILAVVRQLAKLPVIPVPAGFRFQPVDTDEVAARLAGLALGAPAGLVPDLAGPTVHELADLVRDYLAVTHRRRPILPVRLPGKAARAFRAGVNLAPDQPLGRRSWAMFLADRSSRC
ncbi:MAG TPA: SDR family oxidoreductase [Pseudonocardiaceae bacterium]|jgi:uncharacterized protein YbjT (DUF2867 family)|nr:SDR family oxidoreductase [Pseudonocardiaceae bacterium]